MKRQTLKVAVAGAIATCAAMTATPSLASPDVAPAESTTKQAAVRVGDPVERVVGDIDSAAPASAEQVQVMIDDMAKLNDVKLGEGAGRLTGPGRVVMGNNPRGTNTPSEWRDHLVHDDYKSDALWTAINPWVVVYPGPDNKSSNTRVEIGTIKLNILRHSTNKWEVVQVKPVSGELYSADLRGTSYGKADLREGADGAKQWKYAGNDKLFHGWGDEISFDTGDIKALHVNVDSKLVLDNSNGVDDRAQAQFLIQVGADYYPEVGVRTWDWRMQMDNGGGYFPGVGTSRAKLVTNQVQTYNFVTVDSGVPEPGGSITEQELRDNPPPA